MAWSRLGDGCAFELKLEFECWVWYAHVTCISRGSASDMRKSVINSSKRVIVNLKTTFLVLLLFVPGLVVWSIVVILEWPFFLAGWVIKYLFYVRIS